MEVVVYAILLKATVLSFYRTTDVLCLFFLKAVKLVMPGDNFMTVALIHQSHMDGKLRLRFVESCRTVVWCS